MYVYILLQANYKSIGDFFIFLFFFCVGVDKKCYFYLGNYGNGVELTIFFFFLIFFMQ